MAGNKNSGRPTFVATDEQREKVRVLRASNMSLEAIASAIDVSEPTLRKYFGLDLEIGSAKVKAEVLMARFKAAVGGNVQAQNRILDDFGLRPEKPDAKQKLGKKEQAKIDAEKVPSDTGWSDLIQ